jgi:chain length determinant protein EpsF
MTSCETMNQNSTSRPPQSTYLMTVGHLLAILRARWPSIVVVLLVALALGAAASMLLPKRYTASATVLVDVRSPDPISGLLMQGMMTPSYMNTQVDLLTSDPIARRAVRELRLADVPSLVERWREATDGIGELEVWAAKLISRDLKVAPAKDSNVLEVTYTSPDPTFAASAANAFVKAYVDTTLQLRQEPAKRHKQFFDSNAKQFREELEAAQARLSDFEKKNGIIGDDRQVDVETTRLVEMTGQVVLLQAQESDSRNRRLQGSANAELLQESMASPLVGALRADLQRARAKLSEMLANRGDNHPQVIELRQSIDELQRRIAEETRRVSGSVTVVDRVNQQRLSDARNLVEGQRAKVAKLKALRDDSVALRRDVENAQKAYDTVLGRANQMGLESQVAQTNVSVVGLASTPTEPSSPNVVRNMLAAVVLGLLSGLALALWREFRDQRVRLEDEIPALLQQPVLVTLPHFGRRRGLVPLATPAAMRAKRLTAA